MFDWIKNNTTIPTITIYPNNITLNSSASLYFIDTKYCLLGLSKDKSVLGIKLVTKREIDLKLVSIENLHKVHLGKGYARISYKPLIDELSELLNVNIDKQKFVARFDDRTNTLVVELKRSAL